MYGQEIVLSNATAGTTIELRLEQIISERFEIGIKNFEAIFEFEYNYEADVDKLRDEFELIGLQLKREQEQSK